MTSDNGLQFGNRFVQTLLVQQKLAKRQMSHIIFSGHGQRMPPKPFAIVPVPNLVHCADGERAYYDGGGCAKDWPMKAPGPGKIDNPPRGRDAESDLRQISITIGVRLSADLDYSDYRQEHDQIPTPPHHEIRASFSEREHP